MALTYYDEFRKPKTRLATAMMVWNAILSFGMAFYWSGVSALFDGPVRWAMAPGVGLNPGWLDYPFVMLWLAPMLCMGAGWMALKGGQDSVARIVGVYPTLMMMLALGWFYLTPPHWH